MFSTFVFSSSAHELLNAINFRISIASKTSAILQKLQSVRLSGKLTV